MTARVFLFIFLLNVLYFPPLNSQPCIGKWPKTFPAGYCLCAGIFLPIYTCINRDTREIVITTNPNGLPPWADVIIDTFKYKIE